jgi:hypothetical protein
MRIGHNGAIQANWLSRSSVRNKEKISVSGVELAVLTARAHGITSI